MVYQTVLNFWFEEIEPQQRWIKDLDFDQQIKQRFAALHQQASQGELYPWRDNAQGRLAEIIVLDQFSRNMYRNTAQAFAYDAMALTLAQEAVWSGMDNELSTEEKAFLYMPYMHSESATIHEAAVALFAIDGLEQTLDFEKKHQAIIQQFGRYPHRNEILGRTSTPEELAFLQQPNSSF